MNDKVGLLSFPEDTKNSLRPYSNKLAALMETEVSRLVSDAYFNTEKLLKENYNKLELVLFSFMYFQYNILINYDIVYCHCYSIIGQILL